MKSVLITILSVFLYFLAHSFVINSMDSNQGRKILFYYPNGYVLNSNSANKHFIGYNLFKDLWIPEIEMDEESEVSSQVESGFFLNFTPFKDFYGYFIISYLLFSVGIWFLLRSGDVLFSMLFAVSGVFISSNFFLLYFNKYYFLFFLTLSMMAFLLMHLVIRIKGNDVPTKWYILEIAISILVGFIGDSSPENSALFDKLTGFFAWMFFIISTFGFSVILYDAIKYRILSTDQDNQEQSNFKKKLSMGISVCALGWIPLLVIKFNLIKVFPVTLNLIFFALLLFPFAFIYASYGVSYLPQQLVFTSAISYLIQVTLYLGLYFIIIFIFRKFFLINQDILNYFHLIYLIMIVFIGVSIKNDFFSKIETLSFSKQKHLNETLQDMVKVISEPLSLKPTVKRLLVQVTEALKVQKVLVLIPADRFAGIERLKDIGILPIPVKSPIWQYFSKEKDITITSYLSFGSGIREEVFRYLSSLQVQIAYPIFSNQSINTPSSVFLVGEKNDKTNFSIAELRFIKECTRLGNLLMENYMLVISDIETRRMEKNLELAKIQQKTMHTLLDSEVIGDSVEIGHALFPAMGVSGDYLDLFKEDSEIKIFLGDVSGHGIGSGYMVSSVKALVSSLVFNKYSMNDVFKFVNKLLIERFPGNLFMSLIGGSYNLETSEFTFINAGHLHPMLFHKDGSMTLIRTPDRVLGVTFSNFHVETIKIESGDRLIIFSDGVTETFNPAEEIYGMARLEDCIRENLSLSTTNLVQKIIASLHDFRKGSDLSDDVTLICLTKLD